MEVTSFPTELTATPLPEPTPVPWSEVLRPRWRALVLAAAIGGLGGAFASRLLPRWYQASAKLAIVPAHDANGNAGMEEMQAASAMLPMLTAILQSRSLAEDTARELGLTTLYHQRTNAGAAAALERHLNMLAERKANLVTVLAEDRSPERARQIAQAIALLAQARLADLWASRSREDRVKIEARLTDERAALSQAEDALRRFRDDNHVVDLAQQVKESVTTAAELERLRIERGLDERYALGFASSQSPEARRDRHARKDAQAELAALIHQGGDAPLLALDAIPGLQLEYGRLDRAVRFHAQTIDVLSQQIAQLNAAEARPAGRVAIVDPARAPLQPSRPKPAAFALAGALACAGGLALLFLYGSRRKVVLLQ